MYSSNVVTCDACCHNLFVLSLWMCFLEHCIFTKARKNPKTVALNTDKVKDRTIACQDPDLYYNYNHMFKDPDLFYNCSNQPVKLNQTLHVNTADMCFTFR